MTTNPLVTVVMPVYNGEKYLKEAIDSILNQTFTDFEFLIIDDGSRDSSAEIINSYKDKRITLISNNYNLGRSISKNKGIRSAKGKYIALMDCDDISYSERLAIQVKFMEENKEVDICGSYFRTIGDVCKTIYTLPIKHEEIKAWLIFSPKMSNPSSIMRTSSLINNKLFYNPSYPTCEDYHLWMRSMNCCRFANIPKILLIYNVDNSRIKYLQQQRIDGDRVRREILNQLNITYSVDELKIHNSLCRYGPFDYNKKDIIAVTQWVKKLHRAVQQSDIFETKAFERCLYQQVNFLFQHLGGLGLWTLYQYLKLPIKKRILNMSFLKLVIKCLIKWKRKE